MFPKIYFLLLITVFFSIFVILSRSTYSSENLHSVHRYLSTGTAENVAAPIGILLPEP